MVDEVEGRPTLVGGMSMDWRLEMGLEGTTGALGDDVVLA